MSPKKLKDTFHIGEIAGLFSVEEPDWTDSGDAYHYGYEYALKEERNRYGRKKKYPYITAFERQGPSDLTSKFMNEWRIYRNKLERGFAGDSTCLPK